MGSLCLPKTNESILLSFTNMNSVHSNVCGHGLRTPITKTFISAPSRKYFSIFLCWGNNIDNMFLLGCQYWQYCYPSTLRNFLCLQFKKMLVPTRDRTWDLWLANRGCWPIHHDSLLRVKMFFGSIKYIFLELHAQWTKFENSIPKNKIFFHILW